ncbi:NAD(P)H-dependent oxidoreductase [Plebeiibacterium marinum]|uniref:NAD(P)H-dependent oxidoreductase n=1 Tax=Plebeiibacterium marinum TaxID=2992111 RepID=A0AAE3MD91_9BACT|nr:NAD(P)H-dependent oxidoreductase [Plebeiobacterium marinum]MCW3805306.1 NAD(P)H-dependent oxidoreductase [Plebeiobacterium marinum]
MELIKQLNWRYATKHFDASKKINTNDLNTLLDAVNLAPTSYGLQPFKVLVVEDENKKQKLKEAGYQQPQFTEASHIILLAAKNNISETDVDEFMNRIAKARNLEVEDLAEYKNMMLAKINSATDEGLTAWASKQCYIALGFLLYTAAQLSIDACPMEGFDSESFDDILGLKEKNLKSVVLATVGYRSKEDKYQSLAKVRYDLDDLVIKY